MTLRRLPRMVVAVTAMLVCTTVAAAQSQAGHRLARDTQQVELFTSGWILDDPSGAMTPEEVAAAAVRGEMRHVAKERISYFGDGTQRAVWFKFDLSTDAAVAQEWRLEVSRPDLRRVQIFTSTPEGRWVGSQELGDSLPFSARPIPHRNFVFPVQVHAGTSSLLLRVQSDVQGHIQATLWQPAAFATHELAFFNATGVYLGILAAMLLYNLLVYVMVRDRGYILYVACIGATWLAYWGNTGLATQFIFGDDTWWSGRFIALCWSATVYFRTALTRHFLSTRERLPLADKALAMFGWAALASIIACFFLPRTALGLMVLLTGLGSSLLVDAVSIVAVVRRWPGAPYYCASWMVLSVGVIGAAAHMMGFVPTNEWLSNVMQPAAAVSYILLSIALAHQINEEKRQKEQAQAHTLAIVQASQALSSETRLDKLHARLREIMVALTGASSVRCVIRDPDNKGWFLYDPEGAGRLPVEQAVARGLLPMTALRHVESTREPLVIADALGDERFAADPALSGAARCSLMVLPVLQQGEMHAVLILERRGASSAFSPALMDTVASIAGPMAVALENVLLYERLEQRVADQTRELRDTQKELVATARRAGMAEVATNVLHNVGNALNSVNVTAELMRARVRESHVTGLARAVDLLDANEKNLGAFMQHDPRGRLLPQYFRQVADELSREREELLVRVGELTANVDHIKSVVATQQTFAGSSTFVEPLRPAELIEDALRITDDPLQHDHIEIVTELQDISPVRLDKTRALQILVNLITNAKQAMQHMTDRPRALRLQMDTAQGMLRFRIHDEGCGIAPENLDRIFTHGFTTREGGHGFGLHSCALAASQMGGNLSTHSEGPGRGATFTLTLPLKPV